MNQKTNRYPAIVAEPAVFVSTANRMMLYSQFVSALFKIDTQDRELCHIAMGVSGEAGELCDAIKKHVMYGKLLDRENIVEELGDLRFYMQAAMIKFEITEEEILQYNANKLAKRYPTGGYTNEDAIARADKNEVVPAIVFPTPHNQD